VKMRNSLRVLVTATMVVAGVVMGASPAAAATFTVNTTNDVNDGACNAAHCSLREAINAANTMGGSDTIAFNIVGAPPFTIAPTSALPTITGPVTIDGTTQPGYAGTPVIELNGAGAGPGVNGLFVQGGATTVRALVINRFSDYGIFLFIGSGNTIQANFIGTDSTGTIARPNADGGMQVNSSTNNVIGGTSAATRNVISGNGGHGVWVRESPTSGTVISGNYIGTDVSGTLDLGNSGSGVQLLGTGSTVGGTASGAGNVISGNNAEGVQIFGSGNLVAGNLLGLNAAGTAAIGNGSDGIEINNGANNTIGGTTPGARNVISGNLAAGVIITNTSATGNVVRGNYIGTNAAGTAAIPNVNSGVLVLNRATNNTIGGVIPGATNVISGNTGDAGVGFLTPTATNNRVQGNLIGLAANGTSPLPNNTDGVLIAIDASNNAVGGTVSGAGNTIAFNSRNGVAVASGTGNGILGNSIHSNGNLGINLGGGSVNPNDPGDGDSGANNLQNFPVLTSITRSGSTAQINGTLNSQPSTTFRIEFFSNAVCDPSLHGEGETFLGSTSVTTDGSGNVAFTFTASSVPSAHSFFTATATDPANNTSEFSACRMAAAGPGPPATVTLDPPTDANPVGSDHTVTATVRDAAGNPTPGIVVRFSVQGSVTASGQCTTNASGQCSFTYSGPTQPGADTITAFADTNGDGDQDAGEPSGAASKTWVPGAPATVTVEPATATNPVDTEHCVTATVRDALGNPVPGVTVRFSVTGSVTTSGSATTDADGEAQFCYQGPTQPGADAITAFADTNGDGDQDAGEPSGAASKTWVPGAPATVTVEPATATNPVDTEHCVTATVRDALGNPVPGVTVRFSVSGSVTTNGSATTDADGEAQFCYEGPTQVGADTITAFADTNGDGDQDAGEPSGVATKTWVAGAPATVTVEPPTATNPVDTEHCVTATVRDAFGNPVPGVTVRFSVSGSVTTNGSATTDANGEAQFCYQGPPFPGADAITAFADTNTDGDQDAGEPSGTAAKTWVLPVSTPGCEVIITNGGHITAINGDPATFGGNAHVTSEGEDVSGQEEYQDHGPADPMNVHSINVLAVVCSADRTEATIFGQATIDGSGSFDYRIRVKDAGEPGTSDQYGILLSTGYFSGDQTLEGGNVQIHVRED
jgi:CSLREA domain-containing protein